jgi:hypothetical protein
MDSWETLDERLVVTLNQNDWTKTREIYKANVSVPWHLQWHYNLFASHDRLYGEAHGCGEREGKERRECIEYL